MNDLIHFPLAENTPVGVVLEQLGFSIERMMELAILNQQLQSETGLATPTVIPIAEVVKAFVGEWHIATGHRAALAKSSIETYGQVTEALQQYLETNGGPQVDASTIYKLCNDFVGSMVKERDLSAPTRDKYAAIVRRFCWFVYENYLTRRPILPVLSKPTELLPQALSQRAYKELLFAARQGQYGIRSSFFVQFLHATGLRRNEFRHVRKRDIQIGEHGPYLHVTHGKGGKERIIPLPQEILDPLDEYCKVYGISQPSDYLYGHPESPSVQLTNESLSRQFQTIAKRMPSYSNTDQAHSFHLHSMRHTYAQDMLLSGVSLRVLADLLGHQSLRSTAVYTKLDTERMRKAAGPGLQKIGEMIAGRETREKAAPRLGRGTLHTKVYRLVRRD